MKKTSKVSRTTEGLRNVLFDLIDEAVQNKVDHKKAKLVVNLNNSILKTAKIELEAKKLLIMAAPNRSRVARIVNAPNTLLLGSKK